MGEDADFPPGFDKSHFGKLSRIPPWQLKASSGFWLPMILGPCPSLTHWPNLYLAQDLQPLPLSFFCGQLCQLSEQQLGWGGGDVQEVGEGLAE